MRLYFSMLFIWATATSASALEGTSADDSRATESKEEWQTPAITVAPQFLKDPSFGLDESDQLLGKKNLSGDKILSILLPALSDCSATPKGDKRSNSVRIKYFDIQCSGFKIQGAELIVQEQRNLVAGVTLSGLSGVGTPQKFSTADFRPLTEIAPSYLEANSQLIRSDRILLQENQNLTPAWLIVWEDKVYSSRFITTIDAGSGAVINQKPAGINLDVSAQVFLRSPLDVNTSPVVLKGLSSEKLDGRVFSVSAGADVPRVAAGFEGFISDPHSPNTALEFDQIQTYYGASRAADWFGENFGYSPGSATINVRINKLIDNSPNNAAYFGSDEGGPEIQIGSGDGSTLANLGRDTDVVTHEFGHHVISRRLTRTSGESGVIHEGTADYFTYAINNDPYLGRSIKPGAISLRTGAQGPEGRLDNPNFPKQRHQVGQIWSAMLWDLRSQIGAKAADAIVFHGIDYLSSGAGYSEALLGLLQADRDIHPRAAADPEFGIYGEFKCQIIKHGVARGFAQLMEKIDAASCNLDMKQLAAESRAYSDSIKKSGEKKGQKVGFSFAGINCGTIGTATGMNTFGKLPPLNARLWQLGLMLLPLLFGVFRHRKSCTATKTESGGTK